MPLCCGKSSSSSFQSFKTHHHFLPSGLCVRYFFFVFFFHPRSALLSFLAVQLLHSSSLTVNRKCQSPWSAGVEITQHRLQANRDRVKHVYAWRLACHNQALARCRCRAGDESKANATREKEPTASNQRWRRFVLKNGFNLELESA